MQPLGTKVYLLKRYSPSDSFCTFLSESVPWRGCCESVLQCTKTYSKTCDRMVSWTWPTQSPYLNMFERLWGILEEQVRKCFSSTNITQWRITLATVQELHCGLKPDVSVSL